MIDKKRKKDKKDGMPEVRFSLRFGHFLLQNKNVKTFLVAHRRILSSMSPFVQSGKTPRTLIEQMFENPTNFE